MTNDTQTISYAPVVKVIGESSWHKNALRFATHAAAMEWAHDLSLRWTLVTAFDVEETTDAVNRPETA